MKILQLCRDMFDCTPRDSSVKDFFREMRAKYHEEEDFDDRKIFGWWSGYLGSRSYNNFLDYSLFAIKLKHIYDKFDEPGKDNNWEQMKDAITNLLADDRHDMYQNVPYELEDVAETLDIGEQLDFWQYVVDAMIDCINVYGTGDTCHQWEVPET